MPGVVAPQHMGDGTVYDIDAVRREWEGRETPLCRGDIAWSPSPSAATATGSTTPTRSSGPR